VVRAAVLVGVSKSGDLPKLQAVDAGIDRMREWCSDQGISESNLSIITDHGGKVTVNMIRDAVDGFIAPGNVEQLIIYFSGHGIYNRGDLWLLSDAPRYAGEAVNVEGSIQLARYCGIDHIVFISDACRVAANSIQATGVTGTEIFPNDPVDGKERAVDAFFACARGKPSLEVRQPEVAAGEYSAIYTEVLSECLRGVPHRLVEASASERDVGLVRMWPLSDELQQAVPLRLSAKLGKQASVNQTPTARISSRSAWLSRLARPGIQTYEPVETLSDGEGCSDVEMIIGSVVLRNHATSLGKQIRRTGWRSDSDVRWVSHVEAGVAVSGAELVSVQAAGRCYEADTNRTNLVDLGSIAKPVAALVELRHGRGTIVPVLPGMVTELVVESGELAKVIHQPGNTLNELQIIKWEKFGAVRKLVNEAGQTGMFSVSPRNEAFFKALRETDLIDPSVALHAAYALQAAGMKGDIVRLNEQLVEQFELSPFDLRMLIGGALAPLDPQDADSWPFLSQAWTLLRALRIGLPKRLLELESHLASSVWTSFDADGIQIVRGLMQ